VGTVRNSSPEYYVSKVNPILSEHIKKFSVQSIEEGVQHLK
jgi:hypothetical protein